jgi:TolA-binding protein
VSVTIQDQLLQLEERVEEIAQIGSEETEYLNQQLIELKKRVLDLERQVTALEYDR